MNRNFLTITALIAATAFAVPASAQSLFPFQQEEILGNNLQLQGAAGSCESTKLDNTSGLTLANPEVGISYMFGSPSDVPNRTNIEVTQGFDFPTLSGARSRVAKASNRVADAAYMSKRSQTALEVENALINYVYQYLLVNELEKYAVQRQQILATAEQSLKSGLITYPEYNVTELANLKSENELATARMELASAENELSRLNGGKLPGNLPKAWPAALLPGSFDEWVETAAAVNPELIALQAELEKSSEELNLRKKEGLPEFSVGYVNELVQGANYHGAAIGFSLPLWGNSGRVKAAKALNAAAQMNLSAAADQFKATKKAEYDNAVSLLSLADQFDNSYATALANSSKYLELAREKRTMGTLEYLTAKAGFYEYALRCLEARRNFHLARAALYAPTL